MANPIGEDSWLAYLEETARTASDLEQRVNVVEVYKRAVSAEPDSLRVWLAYCNYFWSLWAASQSPEAGWSEEDRMMGRELFSFGSALDLWQQAYEAIKYRIDDSHLLWDRWISLEMELLAKTRTPDGVKRITHLYRNRLATPHMTWDDTSSAFSTFLNEYNRASWEDEMKDVTVRAQDAKRLIAARDSYEMRLKKAASSGDTEAQKEVLKEYLEWEMMQSKRNNDKPEIGIDLCRGLYARALTGILATDETTWHDYVVFLSSSYGELQTPDNLIDVVRRAVQHCPWSGKLWSRCILCAEEARLPFSDIESLKHAATSENQLYRDGMDSMIEMYTAWCNFLKRTAMDATATDEAVDLADVGLTAALEDVDVVGKRLYGKDFQGDPKFRLQRIYIQYLTEKKNAIDEARILWNKLASIPIHADSYDFWCRYYMWEMSIFTMTPANNRSPTPASTGAGYRVPTLATDVLYRASKRRTVDWPEKIFEVYLQHCHDYEPASNVRRALDLVHKLEKGLQRRRAKEEQDKAAAYAAYYQTQEAQQPEEQPVAAADSPGGSKRKRDDTSEVDNDAEGASKRQKSEVKEQQSSTDQTPKRDREHSTILVENLPAQVEQTKVKQYFKDYGHIKNITALVHEADGKSSTALIEFSSQEEAQSALLRDKKYFGESQLSVRLGINLTVYVANFPPTADEKYTRNLFSDCGEILSIRWPSLKANTHRRFCYISFRDSEASAKATKKDGLVLEGRFRLLSKYSDPNNKKHREGALAEGREIHISSLHTAVNEDELRNVFSKMGTISRINMPRNLSGRNRGFAYMDFSTADEAKKAVAELNNVNLRGQIIRVELSKDSKFKPSAKNVVRDSASPAPSPRDTEGDEAMADADQSVSKPTPAEIAARTMVLLGLPDTVNDARVRALVEPLGEIVQLVLHPGRGAAKIEFADAAAAGKAGLQLESMELEGHKLHIGSVDDLRRAKPANEKPAPPAKQNGLAMPQPFRRPLMGKSGPKRGLGFAPTRKPPSQASAPTGDSKPEPNGKPAPKSNADFKAMFLAGKGEAPKKNGVSESG
ncbi:hypothetical protein B0I35DRAFT_449433 [Stachybotrys elegans]|uniref:RRM domain-containing protein n=1 Tax=Stachybotrys elegans TaxID=80388 RepID=A0A8K0WTT7_9HYPO|nr:hypothetical protein B0I35DRAFT_449433 [Stachybotrys elegans]